MLRHRAGNGEVSYLLTQRSRWVDEGGTWGIPGGAIRDGETPECAAFREARKRLASCRPTGLEVDEQDCGGGWVFRSLLPMWSVSSTPTACKRPTPRAGSPRSKFQTWRFTPGSANGSTTSSGVPAQVESFAGSNTRSGSLEVLEHPPAKGGEADHHHEHDHVGNHGSCLPARSQLCRQSIMTSRGVEF